MTQQDLERRGALSAITLALIHCQRSGFSAPVLDALIAAKAQAIREVQAAEASDEAGHRVTCRACGLCIGRGRPTARSIAIVAHGRRTAFLVEKKTAAALPEVFV